LHIRNTYIKIWKHIYITYLRTRVQIIIFFTRFHSSSLSCISQFSLFLLLYGKYIYKCCIRFLDLELLNCKILHYIHRAYLWKCLPIWRVFGCIPKIAKSDCQRRQVCVSVHLHGKTRLTLEGFSCCFIFEDFFNNRRKNWNFIKIWQE
jgi:hypothetical protein